MTRRDSDVITLVNRKTGETIETTWGEWKKAHRYLVDVIERLEAEEAEK